MEEVGRATRVSARTLALTAILVAVAATAATAAGAATTWRPRLAARPAVVAPVTRPVAAIVIGDSITALNLSTLEQGLHLAPLPDWKIDAQPGRRTAQDVAVASGILRSGRDAIERLQAAGWGAPTWVMELGTNDLPTIGRCGCDMVAAATSRMKEIRTTVGPQARILWVTPRHGTYPAAGAAWRLAALRLAATDPLFSVADWYALSRDQNRWFGDGIHPNATGARALRDLVSDRLQGLLPATVVPSTTIAVPTVAAGPAPSAIGSVGTGHRPAVRLQTPVAVRGGPTTAQRCGSITSTVGPGSAAPAVRAVQCALVQRGYDPGGVTGVFGPSTASAVSAFRRHLSLTAGGTVTMSTGHALGIWNFP